MRIIARVCKLFVILFGSVTLLNACSVLEHEEVERQEVDFPWTKSEGVRNVLRRASQLANITWTPILDVPGNEGVYPAGIEVLGIPYSSTKQIDKYVGLDVTFHTY